MADRKTILRRFERDGRTWRELDCGHDQAEPSGGRAAQATFAECGICNGPKAAPVIGVCTAIILPLKTNKAQPCGKPAKHLKRGLPRCSYHFKRGVRG